MQTSYSSHLHFPLTFYRLNFNRQGDREGSHMYSICGKTFAMALAALWAVFTPAQLVPQTTPVDYQTLLHLQAAHVILWAQSQEPISVELRMPTALINALLTEKRSSETIDLRVPEALLEHLYGAGRVSGLKKSPVLWNEFLSGEVSVALH